MQLQPEFFLHIINGGAEGAGPLLARLALNLGYDSAAYPFDLAQLKNVGDFFRDPGSCGFNEFFVADYVRAAIMGDATSWDAKEVAMLRQIADRPLPDTIASIYPYPKMEQRS